MTYQPSLFDGQAQKEMGQEQVLRNSGDQWKEMALDCIIDLSNSCEFFTSDDLRRTMDILIPPNPNSYGAIFSAAAKMKLIRKTGLYIKSKIPSCHARVISIWKKY